MYISHNTLENIRVFWYNLYYDIQLVDKKGESKK